MLGPRSIAAEKAAPRGFTNGHQNHFGSAITLDGINRYADSFVGMRARSA